MNNDKTNELGLRDKVVVVTGATSGSGCGAAMKFAKAGAAVVVAARRYHLLSRSRPPCWALRVTRPRHPSEVGVGIRGSHTR